MTEKAPRRMSAAAEKAYAEGRLKPLPRIPTLRPESDYEMHLPGEARKPVTAPTPLPGDFVLVRMSGPGGRAIRVLQYLDGSGYADFEHAALYAGDGQLIEMWSDGIRLKRLSDYDGVPQEWSTGKIPLTDAQRDAICAAARGYLAAKISYSWPDYGALVLHHFHAPVPGLQGYIQSSKSMICSQLVDRAYNDAGVHLFQDGRWDGFVTPGDLDRLLAGQAG